MVEAYFRLRPGKRDAAFERQIEGRLGGKARQALYMRKFQGRIRPIEPIKRFRL